MADHSNVSAMITKAMSAPAVATTTPPIAGPANDDTLSIVDDIAFEAVNSSGVRAREGSSAAWAGRKAVEATITALVTT